MVMKSALEMPFWYSQNNRLSAQICDEIIASGKELGIESASVNRAGVSADTMENTRLRNASTAFFPERHPLEELLANYIRTANQEAWNFVMSGHEPIQFGAYKRGGFYGWHADIYYHPEIPIRKLSVTVNLSDPKDYAGGNLEMKDI